MKNATIPLFEVQWMTDCKSTTCTLDNLPAESVPTIVEAIELAGGTLLQIEAMSRTVEFAIA